MSARPSSPDENNIPLDEEKLQLLKGLARNDNSLLESVISTFARQEEKYLDGYRSFIYGLLQPLGIIAGFGFTAVGSVKNLWLFILGEAVLIGAILFAAAKVREAYVTTLDGLAKAKDDEVSLVWERVEFSSNLLEQAVKTGKIPINFHLTQSALNKKLMDTHKPTKKDEEYYSFKDHIPFTLISTGVGIALVLLSFISFNFNGWYFPYNLLQYFI